ncbi:MAG: site-specific integrase, partial [Abditibacteriota bacterium]|nr:site-specific integrase [Abditibacteriota bacterium]
MNSLLVYTDAFTEYLRSVKNRSENTVTAYKKDTEDFLNFLGEREADKNNIRSWLVTLQKQGMSKRSIARKLSSLRVFYGYLTERGFAAENPFVLTTA